MHTSLLPYTSATTTSLQSILENDRTLCRFFQLNCCRQTSMSGGICIAVLLGGPEHAFAGVFVFLRGGHVWFLLFLLRVTVQGGRRHAYA